MYETLARIRVSYHSAEHVLTAAVLEHGLHNITHESPGAWINGIQTKMFIRQNILHGFTYSNPFITFYF